MPNSAALSLVDTAEDEPDTEEKTTEVLLVLESGWCPECRKAVHFMRGNIIAKITGKTTPFWECIGCENRFFVRPPAHRQ